MVIGSTSKWNPFLFFIIVVTTGIGAIVLKGEWIAVFFWIAFAFSVVIFLRSCLTIKKKLTYEQAAAVFAVNTGYVFSPKITLIKLSAITDITFVPFDDEAKAGMNTAARLGGMLGAAIYTKTNAKAKNYGVHIITPDSDICISCLVRPQEAFMKASQVFSDYKKQTSPQQTDSL